MKRKLATVLAVVMALSLTGCGKGENGGKNSSTSKNGNSSYGVDEYLEAEGDILDSAAAIEDENANLVVNWLLSNDVSAYDSVQKYKELSEAGSEYVVSDTNIVYETEKSNVHIHIPKLKSGIGVLRGANLRYNEDGTVDAFDINELVLSDQDFSFAACGYNWYENKEKSCAFFGYVEELELSEAIEYIDAKKAIEDKTAYEAVEESENYYVDEFKWFSIKGDTTSKHLYACVGYDGVDADAFDEFNKPTLLNVFVKDTPFDGYLSMVCGADFSTHFTNTYLIDCGPISDEDVKLLSDTKFDNKGEDALYAFMNFKVQKDVIERENSDIKLSLIDDDWVNNTGEYILLSFDAFSFTDVNGLTFYPGCNNPYYSTLVIGCGDIVIDGLKKQALYSDKIAIAPGESLHLKFSALYQGEDGDIMCYPIIQHYEVTTKEVYNGINYNIKNNLERYPNYIVDAEVVPSQYKPE